MSRPAVWGSILAALAAVAAAEAAPPAKAAGQSAAVQAETPPAQTAVQSETVQVETAPPAYAAGQSATVQAETRAGRLQSEGKVKEAEQVLSTARSECAPGEAGKDCRHYLDYSLGYLYQSKAGTGEPRDVMLRSAAGSYEKLLSETPAHGPSVDNLLTIYRELGEPERAVPVLQHAMEADPEAAGGYALQLGDVYLALSQPEEARRLYEKAARESPSDEAAVQRIVLTYQAETRAASAPDPGELIRLGQEWEKRFPASAREAYETAIRAAYRKDAWTGERALALWAAHLARGGSLTMHDLKSLPADWDTQMLRDLRSYLAKPESGIGQESRWATMREGRVALLLIAVALGRERLEGGDLQKAEAVWQGAARLIGQREPSSSALELQIELASLYSSHPELDADGQKFLSTEMELFRGKGNAIAQADLETIQRYHTALGLLYVERGQWESKGSARGAIFQLRHALSTADKRWQAEGFYQPLAKLRELLADGYRKTGDLAGALRTYLNACRAYLDADDLRGAERTLAAVRALTLAGGGEETAVKELAGILGLRMELTKEKGTMQGASADLASRIDALAGLADSDTSALPPQGGFGRRQRFKIFADAAPSPTLTVLPSQTVLTNAGRALDLVMKGGATLVGAGDLLRLERVQKIVIGALGVSAKGPEVVPGAPGAVEPKLALSLPTDTGPALVEVSPEAITAARVLNGLGPDTVLRARLELRIRGDSVILYKAAPGWDLKDLADKLASAGVEALNI